MENEWEEVKGDAGGIWLPQKKDEQIEGEIVEIKQGQYGIQVTVLNAKGSKMSTPSHKALQSRLGGFQVGDFIKIVYLGADLPKLKGQQGTRLYAVFKRPEVEQEEVA